MTTAQQYIGSKLSLISKECIRYEGVLYTIDPVAATLTLADVRVFGTENRKPDTPIHPIDKTYAFIRFKGSDLKDIYMCDENRRIPEIPDPAIIDHTETVSSFSANLTSNSLTSIGKQTPMAGLMPPDHSFHNFSLMNKPPPNFYNNSFGAGIPHSAFGAANHGSNNLGFNQISGFNFGQKSPTNDQATQMTPVNKNFKKAPGSHIAPIGPPRNQYQQQNFQPPTNFKNNQGSNNPGYNVANQRYNHKISNNFGNSAYGGHQNFANQGQNQASNALGLSHKSNFQSYGHAQQNNYSHQKMQTLENMKKFFNNANYNQNNSQKQHTGFKNMNQMGGSRPNYVSHHRQNQPQFNENIKDEFDFESANAKFNKEDLSKVFEEKLKIVLETEDKKEDLNDSTDKLKEEPKNSENDGEKIDLEHQEESTSGAHAKDMPLGYYEPKKSFFDNISCQTNIDQKKKIMSKLTEAITKEDEGENKDGKAKHFGTALRNNYGGMATRRPNNQETFGMRRGHGPAGGVVYQQGHGNFNNNATRFNSNYNYRNFHHKYNSVQTNSGNYLNSRNNFSKNHGNSNHPSTSSGLNGVEASPSHPPIKVGGPN